jgi:hypothetical protein
LAYGWQGFELDATLIVEGHGCSEGFAADVNLDIQSMAGVLESMNRGFIIYRI